jgi:hypothetical protein
VEVKLVKWNVRLASGLGMKKSPKISRAAEVLRSFCLRWYKRRRLTQSYFWWLHHSAKFKRCGIAMSRVVKLDQMFNPKDAEEAELWSAKDVYRWAKHGRSIYLDWWSQRVTSQAKDLKSGQDVIKRSCNSTWWDWSDGSCPADWKWPKWYQSTIQYGLPIWFMEAPAQWRKPQARGKTKAEHALITAKLRQVRNRRYVEPGYAVSLTPFFAAPKGVEDIRMV